MPLMLQGYGTGKPLFFMEHIYIRYAPVHS